LDVFAKERNIMSAVILRITIIWLFLCPIVSSVVAQQFNIPGWEALGPSNIPLSGLRAAGKLQAFAFNRGNPLEMYAGGGLGPGNSGPTTQGGIYKTTDGGAAWKQINSGLTDTAVGTLWIDQANPNILLAGTFFKGIFRSTDYGEHWSSVKTCPGITPSSLGSTSAFLQSGGALYAATAIGVAQSTDDGLTWCIEKQTNTPVRALTASGDAIYAGLDDGQILTRSKLGQPWISSKPTSKSSTVWSISAHPTDPLICYVVDWQYDYSASSLFLTKDGGKTWTNIITPVTAIQFVAYQPSNPQVIYAGADGPLYRSRDGGVTWSRVSGINYDIRSIMADAGGIQDKVVIGSDHGIFISNDNGGTWESVNGNIPSSILITVAVQGSTILTTAQDFSPIASYDAGKSWRLLPGFEGGAALFNPGNPSYAYLFTGSGFQYSIDGGKSFRSASGIPGKSMWASSLAVDAKNPSVIYAASTDGIYMSQDWGQSFKRQTWSISSNPTIVAVDPSDSQKIFVGVQENNGGHLYFTRDGGSTWKESVVGGEKTYHYLAPLAIAIDPSNSQNIFLGLPLLPPLGGVFVSTDGGQNFKPSNNGFDLSVGNSFGTCIFDLAFDPTKKGTIFAATWSGLYFSSDLGAHWMNIRGNAVPNTFTGMTWANGYLYATTFGEGVLRTPINQTMPASSIGWQIGSGGAGSASTTNSSGPALAGYAAVAVNSGNTPYGTAVFSFKQHGITVSEAGVPASPPTTSARVFIDYRSGALGMPGRLNSGTVNINTGIGIVNLGSDVAHVTFALFDVNGASIATGQGTLAAGNHLAKFIDQLSEIAPDFVLPSYFQFGSLSIVSDQPLSVLALRMTTNQRGEDLFTTTPVVDMNLAFTNTPIHFPQLADGGGWTTSLVLLNTSSSVEKGSLNFFDNDGLPLAVQQVGGAANYYFQYSIPPGGAFRFQTDGTPLGQRTGWARLVPDAANSTPMSSGIFGYNPVDVLTTESGIPSALATTHARIFVDLTHNHNTGLAIANLSAGAANIVLQAYQMDGVTFAGSSQGIVSLAAFAHDVKFATQLISGLPADFTGILDISAPSPFAAITVRSLYNERGDFLLTAFPIADVVRPAPSPIIFPHIADGGGYVTQFILISPTGEASTAISFYDEDGKPLAVGNGQLIAQSHVRQPASQSGDIVASLKSPNQLAQLPEEQHFAPLSSMHEQLQNTNKWTTAENNYPRGIQKNLNKTMPTGENQTEAVKQIPVGVNQAVQRGPSETIVVTSPRVDIPINETPAAIAVVFENILHSMPRGIGAEEALKLVPGIKVDNQADGERIHLSIRGQGLMTERGIRGIKILLDGLPLNDPTGFARDLFDVDWDSVQRLEVFRGAASALYGGGSSGGVINIETRDGGNEPMSGNAVITAGKHGFYKTFGEVGGNAGNLNYRIAASNTAGEGYRIHTAFRALNLYGKFSWKLGHNGKLTAILAGTNYFNENAEGLNQSQLIDPRQPNPDALKFNEYQRTRRVTVGLTGQFQVSNNQEFSFSAHFRNTAWRESVPSSVEHAEYNTPGTTIQWTIHSRQSAVRNHFSVGSDMDQQTIWDYRNLNLGGAREGSRVSNNNILQRAVGIYALDRIELGSKVNFLLDLRHDAIYNRLTDNFSTGSANQSGSANFHKTTGRVGLAYNPLPNFSLYTSIGHGFLPPATEELTNNPNGFGGFNTNLKPATSIGEEFGVRGNASNRLNYDVAFFHLGTKADFGRYRVPNRPLETFYNNIADSRRYGIEGSLNWYPLDPLAVRVAYTLSDFKYTSVQSIFGTFKNVWVPNSPRNQAYVDAEYTSRKGLFFGFGCEMLSRAYIDQTNTGYAWGYALFNPRMGYRWSNDKLGGEIILSGRNALAKRYIAFTEPDPDGNSYQPGPMDEWFITARLYIGEKK
jgi:iron complex outermembrane recepter protein